MAGPARADRQDGVRSGSCPSPSGWGRRKEDWVPTGTPRAPTRPASHTSEYTAQPQVTSQAQEETPRTEVLRQALGRWGVTGVGGSCAARARPHGQLPGTCSPQGARSPLAWDYG